MKTFFSFIVMILFSVSGLLATDNNSPAPTKKVEGNCSASHKGKKDYYKKKYLSDANRNGQYDTELIIHCNGEKEVREIKEKSIFNSANIEVLREDCTDDDIFELGYDHFAVQCEFENEIVAIEYTNTDTDEEGYKTVYIFPVFDAEVLTMYIDQYVGLTIEQTIMFQDVATGNYFSELRVAGDSEIIGIEFKLSPTQNPIRIYFKPQD